MSRGKTKILSHITEKMKEGEDDDDSPRIESDIDDSMEEEVSPVEQMTEEEMLWIRKMQYYGKFSAHSDPEAMQGLMALKKNLTNDFTAAENSGTVDLFQTQQ